MSAKISRSTRDELLNAIRQRYGKASRDEKRRILDEVVALMKCHRKHAIRLLRQLCSSGGGKTKGRERIYDEAVRAALVVLWEAADRICGKRLKAILPSLLESMESHGHLRPDPALRERLLSVSAATIDRLLSSNRSYSRPRTKRRSTKPSKRIPAKTFTEWEDSPPGFLEIDFVVHCGGSMSGRYIHSLVATDVCSGWTESIPLLVREQTLVTEGLTILRNQYPIVVQGINSDNDSAFINETLLDYCEKHRIKFTRSRAYRKNDQAWIEQKNGAVIRKFVGYDRFSGIVAGQALSQLYQSTRLYVNFFQPSFKLRKKTRHGSKVKKEYYPPATPCERLLSHADVSESTRESLLHQRSTLDPVDLLHRIRKTQEALAGLTDSDSREPVGESLSDFLATLPSLWKQGEARPTHRNSDSKPRDYRTRKDPFESVWSHVITWLQREPDATAKELFTRLQHEHPGQFTAGQLRTLQRRVRQWRQVIARQLVFGESEIEIPVPPGVVSDESEAAES